MKYGHYNFNEIGLTIRNERNAMKLSQERFLEEMSRPHNGEMYGSSINRNTLSSLENGDDKKFCDLTLGKLMAICFALDVDVGHLLGEYDERHSIVSDIEQYTGLSKHSIEILHYMTLPETSGIVSDVRDYNMRTISFINRALDGISIVGDNDGGRMEINTIFADMEDYARSDAAYIPNEKQDHAVTIRYGTHETTIHSVSEFLRGQLKEAIICQLENFRSRKKGKRSKKV